MTGIMPYINMCLSVEVYLKEHGLNLPCFNTNIVIIFWFCFF